VVAAIDLSSHTATISVERLADRLRPHLVAAADRISARLGYRRDDEVITGGWPVDFPHDRGLGLC
jgi:hypothetical protein